MSKNLTTEEMKKIAANTKKTKIAAHANQYGQWVKQKRKEKRISQKDLCEMAEISTVYLSKIENGFKLPSNKIQNKLETIFVKPDPINIEQETIKHSNGILKNLYNELKEIYGKGEK